MFNCNTCRGKPICKNCAQNHNASNPNHIIKLLDVHEEEALKKEKISIQDSIKDINKYKNKVEELKNKIENEIVQIDKLSEKADKETADMDRLGFSLLLQEAEHH